MKTPSDQWRPNAAYFYLLQCDAVALAWEYLRRNPTYRHDCHCSNLREDTRPAHQWGLRGLEDPDLDCRVAFPRWVLSPASVVRLTSNVEDANSTPFSVWKLPGRKVMSHDGVRLLLTINSVPRPLLFALGGDLSEGNPFDILVSASSAARSVWPTVTRLFSFLERPRTFARRSVTSRPTRESLVHMRTLQALDGHAAGATHREIAGAIFGEDEVFQRWDTNSELRAQLRYLLRRGHGLVDGGYRDFLGRTVTAT